MMASLPPSLQHKCYIVATCDRDLKRRLRKIPGVPIMYISQHRYTVEQMPDDYGGEGQRGGMTGEEQTMLDRWRVGCMCSCNHFFAPPQLQDDSVRGVCPTHKHSLIICAHID